MLVYQRVSQKKKHDLYIFLGLLFVLPYGYD